MENRYVTFPISKYLNTSNETGNDVHRLIDSFERLAKYDSKNDSYTVCAYLIAQLGKNFGIEPKKRISGQVLLARAQDVIEDSQTNVGGIIEFLECEDNAFLKSFYEDNHFTYFDSRYTEGLNSKLLLQYFKFI